MDKFLEILKILKTYFLVTVIGVLLIFIYFKNNKIAKLTSQLNEKPKVEYVYNTKIDTIKVSVPKPYKVVEYKYETDTMFVDVTSSDSVAITQAYLELIKKHGEIKLYDDVLKDDSVAFVQLQEKVQFNTIKDRNLIFLSRVPTKVITNTKNIYTTSIVGGIEAGPMGVEVGAGVVTKRNNILKISYDPVNNSIKAGGYIAIFNFKNK